MNDCYIISVVNLFFVCVLSFFVQSCGTNKMDEKIELIAGTNYKYWDVVVRTSIGYYKSNYNNTLNKYSGYSLYFDTDGNFKNYIYNEENQRVEQKSSINDYVAPNTWEIKSDSIINIHDWSYTIKKLSKDSLYLILNTQYRDTLILVASPAQRSFSKYKNEILTVCLRLRFL